MEEAPSWLKYCRNYTIGTQTTERKSLQNKSQACPIDKYHLIRKICMVIIIITCLGSIHHEEALNLNDLCLLKILNVATTVHELRRATRRFGICGGGGSTSSNWGRDDDEDERERARRYAQQPTGYATY